ncbi:NADAR family protein [Streptomyces cylindrosporus]|uniref:NADAR family protein n=1 Tax=Streptomyces cylindrosporus TaxID=2927583 RepID=A0ABS9YED8_9ACTN|nr:NADAR family protein [Streptomyces cylindrosporus]MCI3275574.1 NADAR family protein [Streptomyces cylindrosporus]
MGWRGPTYRTVDGERIGGTWCHVWRRHRGSDEYFVEDLVVFADGAVGCGELTDLAGLERMLAAGRIAVTDPATPPREEPAGRWASRSGGPLTPESFLAEVADRIEELAGRPTAVQRCREAVGRFRKTPTEANRGRLREAYLAIPAHLRIFCLGDMDRQDRPLRILLTDIGEPVDGDGPVVTAEMHQDALDYFKHEDEAVEGERAAQAVRHADDPTAPGRPAVVLHETYFPNGRPADPGLSALRNDFPAPVRWAGDIYPSVLHGYWALSVAEEADRVTVRDAPTPREAHELGSRAARRDDWTAVRLGVMAGLLRAKFTQHPELAEILLGTGDATIAYTGYSESPYWRDTRDRGGRNWTGRLLELVRAELLAGRVSWPTGE